MTSPPLYFAVLGPLVVEQHSHPVRLPRSAVLRGLLAALAAADGQALPADRLATLVWGCPSAQVRPGTLHVGISRLRQWLASLSRAVAVEHDANGYQLITKPDTIDLSRFTELADSARETADSARQYELLGAAVALVRGCPLVDLHASDHGDPLRRSVNDAVRSTVLAYGDAALRTGHPDAALAALTAHVEREPLDEPAHAQLITTLRVCGRPAEALARYGSLRERLAQDLGVHPSEEVQRAHAAVLAQDRPVTAAPADGRAVLVTPAQLPSDIVGFTGRDAELAQLDALLSSGPAVAVVHGTAGVGKTALVVHWAHRVAARFPDGQLYVNLRGFAPDNRATPATEAIRGFLDALGVPPDRVPVGVDAQSGLFRSALAGRRMLVVLDNALDAGHVRPLLPGSGPAIAVVTSRDGLGPLVAVNGATPVPLDLMSGVEAHAMLGRRLGAERIAAEPHAAAEVAAACARLPLALAIAAARARQSGFTLAHLAAELRDAGRRLDVLDAGDESSRLRAVLQTSYAAVSAPAARLFRLLGRHPGPDISMAAAASLTGRPMRPTAAALAELTRAHLLIEHTPDRYMFHDLLRAYAAEMPTGDDKGALRRILDHYTHTACAATRLLNPHRAAIPLPLGPPADGTQLPGLGDHDEAMAWLAAEHRVLLAVQRQTIEWAGFDTHACQLAWALDTFLNRRGHWPDRIATWRVALAAADRLGDPQAQANAHRAIAHTHTLVGAPAEARVHYGHALELYTRAGDRAGQAYTHRNLAQLAARRQRIELAIVHAGQALALFEETRDRHGQALSLNGLGWYHVQAGDPVRALGYCDRALALHEELGDRLGQANTLDSLGFARHHAGQYPQALDCYRRSLTLIRDLGDRHEEAMTHARIGDTLRAVGDPDSAREAWEQALTILNDLDHPDAATVCARLAAL